ncbi:MAG: dihydroorotase [Erysipelotrichaceae bacterium]|nr:dihydroorotase [Erysipelotrichaceae bacterium]
MKLLIKGGTVYRNGKFMESDVLIDNGMLILAEEFDIDVEETFDATGMHILPGFIDPHVHLREPGLEYKETIKTGTQAAAKGGYTSVFAMPNTRPATDSVSALKEQLRRIEKDGCVHVYPYCAITKGQTGQGEVVDIESARDYTFAFSDDGKGVQKEETMREAMERVREVNGLIAAHCEDESLLHGGYVHEGEWAKEHGYEGISSESEYKQVERDLKLALETGCQYHVCHVSCKESVELIRKYKKLGANVSAEVTPHHLLLCDEDIKGDDGNFKMNPPLRTKEDRDALIAGLQDQTLEIIATDHAPHSEEEKSKGLAGSAMGIVGLETAFGLLYTNLVKKNVITFAQLVDAMSYNCANIFGIEGGELEPYQSANLVVVDTVRRERINRQKFVSKGKNSPFDGWYVNGIPMLTVCDGKVVYRRDKQ